MGSLTYRPFSTIIAPEREQSGRSQAMSLSDIIRLRQHEEKVYSISGTPTDCVMLAIKQLMKDDKPNLILSGVNRGQNLADDINYSGTIGAAMEGAIHGIKSIAFSQVFNIHNEGKDAFDASKKKDGVPVEERVALHFFAIIPLFPTPETVSYTHLTLPTKA